MQYIKKKNRTGDHSVRFWFQLRVHVLCNECDHVILIYKKISLPELRICLKFIMFIAYCELISNLGNICMTTKISIIIYKINDMYMLMPKEQ